METTLFVTFMMTSIALILIPGPNVMVIVSTSLSHGPKRGLQTVLGTSSAMVIQLSVAAIGTTLFVQRLAHGFEWLRWLGIGYLVYLGLRHLAGSLCDSNHEEQTTPASSYSRGFIVSLTNPKTILFFSAYLPQFVSPSGDYLSQIILLSLSFLLAATLFDSIYALMSGQIRHLIQGRRARRIQHGVSGILYLGAGMWLSLQMRT